MHSDVNARNDPQQWITDRWVKHMDSSSIAAQFSHSSSWNRFSLPNDKLNVVAMQALSAALANEGKTQWLDATRLAWRMAVADGCRQSLVYICLNLCKLGHDPLMTLDFQGFRERSFEQAKALCRVTHWTVGEHLANAMWAKVLRNIGDVHGFSRVASELDKPRVLREMLGSNASAVQRFEVVQTLALFELERRSGATRLDWILGLMAELGSDLEAGSTSMRLLLVDSELAVRQEDFNTAFIGALQLSDHMINGHSELCSRADLATLFRNIDKTFSAASFDKMTSLACAELSPRLCSSVSQLESLARDMDRLAEGLPTEMRASLPRLACPNKNTTPHASGTILPFPPRI